MNELQDIISTINVRPRNVFPETGISTLAVDIAGRIDVENPWVNRNGFILNRDSDLDVKLEVSKRIKELIQMAHRTAPTGKSDDFYEGLSHALSCMEQQA